MKRIFLLPLLFLFLLIFEGSFVLLLPASVMRSDIILVPHIMFIALLFMAAYYNPKTAIYYAIVCGFLYELVYVEIIGSYALAFPLIVYLFNLVMKVLHPHLLIVAFFAVLANILMEYYRYGFILLVQGTTMTHHMFFTQRLIPTILLNIVFLIICSYFFKKLFSRLKAAEEEM